jgi:hypothetical protein
VFETIKKEPLGAIAIFVGLTPVIYDFYRSEIATDHEFSVTCKKAERSQIELTEGIFYYLSKCIFSNLDNKPISIVETNPVLINDQLTYPIESSNILPTINFDNSKFVVYSNWKKQLPEYVRAGESRAFTQLFALPIGKLKPEQSEKCVASMDSSANFETATLCIDGLEHLNVRDAIYGEKLSYGFVEPNSFGLELSLTNGQRFVVEANISVINAFACLDIANKIDCDRINRVPGQWEVENSSYSNLKSWVITVIIAIIASILAATFYDLTRNAIIKFTHYIQRKRSG